MRGRGREAARAGLAGLLAGAAVLLALGGPARGGDDEPARASSRASAQATEAAAGRALFARMGCGGCHRLAQGAGVAAVGPSLDEVLPTYDAAMLRAKIVDPDPAGANGSFVQMPQDYGRRMSPRELDALVAFLLATVRDRWRRGKPALR